MPRRKKIEEPVEEVRKIKTPPLIKGMHDLLPADARAWRMIKDSFTEVARDFSFGWVDVPTLERFELYAHTIGRNTDAVRDDLISFVDKNEKIALRYDYFPGIARSYVEHSLFNKTPPNKFWYAGSVFTEATAEDGKQRECNSIGMSVFNEKSPSVDAELITITVETLVGLGLTPVVHVNSLGCLACRSEYGKALSGFIKSKRAAVCTECRGSATRDPQSFLACVNQKCQRIADEVPQRVDYLCETCHSHLFKLLEMLDEVGVSYVLDNVMVRDIAYYNSVIYDIRQAAGEGMAPDAQRQLLARGGRCNYAVEMLGGPAIPAAGISVFADAIISVWREGNIAMPKPPAPQVYFAQLSEQAKRRAMSFVRELRHQDFRVVANFSKDSLKSQLDAATRMGVRVILILGQREVVDGTILMRDVESGIQEVINIQKVVDEIKKRLYGQKKK